MKYKIYNQDVLEWAKGYSKGRFHALLCDPPYELNFMNSKWDNTGIAFRPETWAALGEHLYPGAFGMAFSASRNWHRLAVAIEDAGFVIHPTIFGWLNGQGFPKATNVSKQIENGKVVGKTSHPTSSDRTGNSPFHSERHLTSVFDKVEFETDMGKAWKGHRYGLQALKPAIEPIIVFQKPYEGKPINDIVSTGAGALNIDAGRIAGDVPSVPMPIGGTGDIYGFKNGIGRNGKMSEPSSLGRWPSNFLLDEETAPLLDAQTGERTSGIPSGKKHAENNIYGQYKNEDVDVTGYGDTGGTSCFFYTVSNSIDEADPIYYCAKVSKKERNNGLNELPIKHRQGTRPNSIDITGKFPDHDHRENSGNIHPTVKPIDLATYLAKLLLPPDKYAPRRILIPFSGVASEMIGCAKAGWEQIVGIEFDTENGYVEIAKKRMEYWCK